MQPLRMTLGHVSLRVRNLEASRQFYCGLLGLRHIASGVCSDTSLLALAHSKPEQQRVVLTLTSGLPGGTPLTGLDHFAFEVPSAADVREAYARAKALGAQATAPRVYDGHRQTFLFDPDGYKVEVYTLDAAGARGPEAGTDTTKEAGRPDPEPSPAERERCHPGQPVPNRGRSRIRLNPQDSPGETEP